MLTEIFFRLKLSINRINLLFKMSLLTSKNSLFSRRLYLHNPMTQKKTFFLNLVPGPWIHTYRERILHGDDKIWILCSLGNKNISLIFFLTHEILYLPRERKIHMETKLPILLCFRIIKSVTNTGGLHRKCSVPG